MSRWQGLHIEAEGTGISRPLSEQVNLLGEMLGQAIREQAGERVFGLVEELRVLCKRAAMGEDPAAREQAEQIIRALTPDEMDWVLRSYTAFFHLANQAERQEIVRINRERAHGTEHGKPRPDSIDEAIHALKARGLSLDEVLALLARLDIQPTLTAHPTEARRRSVLDKQQRIAELLTRLRRQPTPDEMEDALDGIYAQITLLLTTGEVRVERPTVQDEVEQGIYFLQGTIWEAIPEVHRDVARALRKHYGAGATFEPFLRFRSWIGADRDGNPNVTPDVTRWTLSVQRRAALRRYTEELRALRRELSISSRRASIPDALLESVDRDATELSLGDADLRQFQMEPYRLKLTYMLARVEAMLDESRPPARAYRSADFRDDLRLIERSLRETGFAEVVENGRLARVLVLADTFGFHLAALDVRQHSSVHEQAITEILRYAGVVEDYAALSEQEKLKVLTAELANPRPLLPRNAQLPDTAKMVLETCEAIREAVEAEPESISCYIVSMTHAVSDLLEPMLLTKEAGIWTEGGCPQLDFVPLFETIDDLETANEIMPELFEHPTYRKQIAARGGFQEIMLGYSDSNKDGGYWMANWALHKAQRSLGETCVAHGVDFRFFHGRGGTVGRGGGRANQAILAMPPVAVNGRIRVTEQGEVISFRYAIPEIARRHLEQIVSAMLVASSPSVEDPRTASPEAYDLMEKIARRARRAYRDLIDDPGLWRWYIRATPIEYISHLPIASRPISRKSASEVDFEGLRAIPWVFAWTQSRYLVPGWYGVGRALSETLAAEPGSAEQLRALHGEWPFFRAVLNNAQLEMARARLPIAERYAHLADDDEPGAADKYHRIIATDFDAAREAVLRITGHDQIVHDTPVLRKSITLRNPYTDVLSLLQTDLIRRERSGEGDKERLRTSLFLSINGIAAAMQSTG